MLDSPKEGFMNEKSFSTLHHACAHCLDELETATRQTLNLLALVERFPANVEHQTALDMQCVRERKARADFLHRPPTGLLSKDRRWMRLT